jgi:hypothetical protein
VVPGREGKIRELPITDGWILQDNNILACSPEHIDRVFSMLKRQKEPVRLVGGLEASLLDERVLCKLWDLRPSQLFLAYDDEDDYLPLVRAGELLRFANFTRSHMHSYVLIGGESDTLSDAESRLFRAWEAGFIPTAMLWRGPDDRHDDPDWRALHKKFARPALTKAIIKQKFSEVFQ